jgi:hypothetical protein
MPVSFGIWRGRFINAKKLIAAYVLDGLPDTTRPLDLNRLRHSALA